MSTNSLLNSTSTKGKVFALGAKIGSPTPNAVNALLGLELELPNGADGAVPGALRVVVVRARPEAGAARVRRVTQAVG